jgi:5-methylcytosine-specific restriction enzyme subunit McrC
VKLLTLSEQSASLEHDLTVEQLGALQASRAVTVLPSATRSGAWDLRAAQYVGVVRTPELEIRIRPKVPLRNLLFLLGYAADPSGWHDVPLDVKVEDDVVPALASALIHHANVALRRGVLQGYRREDDALLTLRGRLREGDQLRRRFGFPIPVEVTWDEYTVDIPENQLLRTAALLLLRIGGHPQPVRERLLQLVRRLEGATSLPSGLKPPMVRFTRLNTHYRPAIDVATVILTNQSTSLATGGRSGVSFLFDMNRVFEEFLTATLTPALARLGGRVVAQHKDVLDLGRQIHIKPDLTWWIGPSCGAAVDAKYKSLLIAEAPNADIYQMLAYCTALGTPNGWLIYAAGNEDETIHRIQSSAVEIRVATVDLAQRPREVLSAIDELAAKIVERATRCQPAEPAYVSASSSSSAPSQSHDMY